MAKPSLPSKHDRVGENDPELATPRWVKVFGIVALILFLIFILLHATGHSPSGHSL